MVWYGLQSLLWVTVHLHVLEHKGQDSCSHAGLWVVVEEHTGDLPSQRQPDSSPDEGRVSLSPETDSSPLYFDFCIVHPIWQCKCLFLMTIKLFN